MKPHQKLLARLSQANRYCANGIEAIGILSLLLIMVITTCDVIGAKLFVKPVPGSLDIVMLAQSVAISFGMAATLIAGGHVCVEIFVLKMFAPLRTLCKLITGALSLTLFLIIGWQMVLHGFVLLQDGDVSPTAHIPIYPFAFGIALATVPVSIELALTTIKTAFGIEVPPISSNDKKTCDIQ